MKLVPLFALSAGLLVAPVCAQATWQQLVTPNQPPAEPDGLGYDAATSRVLWCGSNPSSGLVEIWAYDGTDWTLQPGAAGPAEAAREVHRASWDSTRRRMVLVGNSQTWEWSSGSWSIVTPIGSHPGPWDNAALVYDPVRQETVYFGGRQLNPTTQQNEYSNETWLWDGTSWSLAFSGGTFPHPRHRHAMTFDTRRGVVIMHGGLNSSYFDGVENSVVRHDQYEWDGTAWQPSGQTFGPAAKGHSLVYDHLRDRTVLYSGSTLLGYRFSTHEFDGFGWEEKFAVSGALARNNSFMVYDEARLQVLMTGGYPASETFVLKTPFPGRTTLIGSGCGGANGAPRLVDEKPPYIDDDFRIRIENLPAGANGVFTLISSGLLPAPVDLTPIGMPGCTLYGTVDIGTSLRGVANGMSSLGFNIPDDPSLAGITFHYQAVVVDPTANALGLATSPNAAITVGIR